MTMKKTIAPLLIVFAAIVVTVLLIVTRPQPEVSLPAVLPRLVEVLEVYPQRLTINVRAQGMVQPSRQTSLISELSGRVTEVDPDFKTGGFFRSGALLLRLDDRDYVAQRDQARALVAQAKSALAQEKGRVYVAKQEWSRRSGKASLSREAQQLALREPQLQESRAQLDSALASLRLAELDLERTEIRAPFDGLVAEQAVDLGQYINVGARIGRLLDLGAAEVRLAIPESKLPYIDFPDPNRPLVSGAGARVTLSHRIDGQQLTWAARLSRSEGVLDERSRSLFVVARLADPYGIYREQQGAFEALRFGMFVDALIEGREVENLIPLPRDVIRPGNRVWIVDEDSRLQQREVTLLRTDGTEVFVSSGLAAGDRVCMTSVEPVLPGTPVSIVATRKQEPSATAGVVEQGGAGA